MAACAKLIAICDEAGLDTLDRPSDVLENAKHNVYISHGYARVISLQSLTNYIRNGLGLVHTQRLAISKVTSLLMSSSYFYCTVYMQRKQKQKQTQK